MSGNPREEKLRAALRTLADGPWDGPCSVMPQNVADLERRLYESEQARQEAERERDTWETRWKDMAFEVDTLRAALREAVKALQGLAQGRQQTAANVAMARHVMALPEVQEALHSEPNGSNQPERGRLK